MQIKILCITDPSTHPPFDTTVELYCRLAADPRFSLYHTDPNAIAECRGRNSNSVRARGADSVQTYGDFAALSVNDTHSLPITEFDLIFHRADRPFPQNYLEQLSAWEKSAPMVNSPSGILKAGNRQFVALNFGQFMPTHVVTRDPIAVESFIMQQRDVIAKQNSSYGGKGISRILAKKDSFQLLRSSGARSEFESVHELLHLLFSEDSEPFEFVRFLRNVVYGDKRVLVIDGEIIGAYLRLSQDSGWINNISQGGRCERCAVGESEQNCVAATWPLYATLGIRTLGYDFLMNDDSNWILSEVNAGNVGGYNRLQGLYGVDGIGILLDWLCRVAESNVN